MAGMDDINLEELEECEECERKLPENNIEVRDGNKYCKVCLYYV